MKYIDLKGLANLTITKMIDNVKAEYSDAQIQKALKRYELDNIRNLIIFLICSSNNSPDINLKIRELENELFDFKYDYDKNERIISKLEKDNKKYENYFLQQRQQVDEYIYKLSKLEELIERIDKKKNLYYKLLKENNIKLDIEPNMSDGISR